MARTAGAMEDERTVIDGFVYGNKFYPDSELKQLVSDLSWDLAIEPLRDGQQLIVSVKAHTPTDEEWDQLLREARDFSREEQDDELP